MLKTHKMLTPVISTLDKLAYATDKNMASNGYTEIYDFYLSRIKNDPVKVLELGVLGGGSIQMWNNYFPNGHITGVDITPECMRYQKDRVEIIIGNLGDENFLNSLIEKFGNNYFDMIIDDASHYQVHQQLAFKKLFQCVKDGGLYIIEDLGTSYWESHSGGEEDSTMNYLKTLIDCPNYHFFKNSNYLEPFKRYNPVVSNEEVNYFDENIYSIQFFRATCLIFKGKYK
jgi:ubiquinone/menaquinone biosynthesis C-methylase UbiE